jgi:hypothetical protein
MKSLFLRVLIVLFLAGALTGHAIAAVGHGVSDSMAGTAAGHHQGSPNHHQDQDSDGTLGFHCMVSVSCLSMFTLAGPYQAAHAAPTRSSWRISNDAAGRPRALDRDPPVPRI